MQKSKKIKLSIIIASENILQAENCLQTLKGQEKAASIETLVVGYSDSGQEAIQSIKKSFPSVKFIVFLEKKSLPILLGEGIRQSKGEIITVTDSTCVMDKNWVSEIIKAHKSKVPVIGGSIEMAKGKSLTDWSAYFCEYSQFMNPLQDGISHELPGNNISFKRYLLKKGKEFTQKGFWKTYWCKQLQAEGIDLILNSAIKVYYQKSIGLKPFLIRRFLHGRCFAGMRIAKMSILKRICYLAGSVLLPLIFLQRLLKVIINKKRYVKEFILSFPISILAILIWSIGEFCGYCVGAGNSCERIYIT